MKKTIVIIQLIAFVFLCCFLIHNYSDRSDSSVALSLKLWQNDFQLSGDLSSSNLSVTRNNSKVLLPYGKYVYPADELLKFHWAVNLKRKLDEGKFGKQLTFLMVNFEYFSTFLNWLAHAKLHAESLMENLLVMCLDEKCENILSNKGIASFVVKPEDVVSVHGYRRFAGVVTARLTVLRLLSYWGYGVLQMDADATPMNNIQPILSQFKDSDIISSAVNSPDCTPRVTYDAWGFCLCVGVILIKSNPSTARMWQLMGNTPATRMGSDQTRFNSFLTSLNVTWSTSDINDFTQYRKGVSADNSITITVLPENVVCRFHCDFSNPSSYYVCHPYVAKKEGDVKEIQLTSKGVWIVSDNWMQTLDTVQSTTEWLNDISV